MLLVSIDPGDSSGACVLRVLDNATPELVSSYQKSGGVDGFLRLIELLPRDALWICEKFSPVAGGGFNQTLKSTLPLVCEGVLIGRGLMPTYHPGDPRYRRPIDQYIFGGKTKADKKKRQHKALKDLGFYRTGKDFGTADADDFRSACAHGLAYLAKAVKHKETFNLISDWSRQND